MAEVVAGLHWQTFTTPKTAEEVMDRMGGSFSEVERRGGFGNPLKVTHESGTRVYFGGQERNQPVVVDASGQVCETWWRELVDWADDLAGVVTRADFAVDLEPESLARRRLVEMKRAWVREKVETNMRVSSFEEMKSSSGWTFYFGGRSADLRFRAYDERGPLRLEGQWRPQGAVGRFLPKMIKGSGVMPVWRYLANHVRFPMPWYRHLLEGDVVTVAPVADEETQLGKFLDQMILQYGVALWALQAMGCNLNDLAKKPKKLKGEVHSKFMKWADEAPALGYDGEKLKAEVRCLTSKSKPS